jgi:predicted  nucleic acid-binding Zn-ribbon protein
MLTITEQLADHLKAARERADYFERECVRLQAEIARLENELRAARAELTSVRTEPCLPGTAGAFRAGLRELSELAPGAFAGVDADAYVCEVRSDDEALR